MEVMPRKLAGSVGVGRRMVRRKGAPLFGVSALVFGAIHET